MEDVTLQVSEAIELINETLSTAFPFILVEGEVAGFKINQGKFVFFDVKDSSGSIGCFMMAFSLKFPLEDGMKVKVLAQPKLTATGKFSLTVREVMPIGEGSLKKSFELLKTKLQQEGLFDDIRKRSLPKFPSRIGVVSSAQAAGYADFLKILSNRWGDLNIVLVDVPVQGMEAPAQIVGALAHLNELTKPLDAIAIIRGGGSADDLSAFNHEAVVRAVGGSRTPVIAGIGHEVDISLADLAADVRAATPSNAAELLVPDKKHILERINEAVQHSEQIILSYMTDLIEQTSNNRDLAEQALNTFFKQKDETLQSIRRTLNQLDPQSILKRGYSLIKKSGHIISSTTDVIIGDELSLQVSDGLIVSEVKDVR